MHAQLRGDPMQKKDARLERWLLSVVPRAVAYARSITSRPDDAEDVVHDVICRLLNHREYDLAADGEKILFRSITNACINRRSRARAMASLDARNRDTGEPVVEPAEESAESDPVAMAIEGELAAAVRRELANLPPLQRAAVELKAMDRSLREIAEILDVTAANAGVLVHRGRKLLAERLAPYLQES